MAKISAVLTAAGESSRMGRPKALLDWRAVTLVEYQIGCLLRAGVSEVVVVLGHQAEAIAPSVARTDACYVVNPDYRLGKATSIKTGLRSIDPLADVILLLAVDQPRTDEIISAVVQAHLQNEALITSPRHRGHGGHPLMFSASLRGELERISEESQGVREVFLAHRDEVTQVELDDPMVLLDINTLEEYEEAKRRYGA